jgi:outer membrane protein OmpA-like peptidoglycan-associated protein
MKRLSLFFFLVLTTLSVFPQQSTEVGRKATFVRNGFWDNWFVGAGAGASVVFSDHSAGADFLSRPTLAPTVQVGKWYNPYLGARLKFQGGSLHNFFSEGQRMVHSKSVLGEVDVLWNPFNYFGKYNEDRFYSLIPYLGAGYAYGWDYKTSGMKAGTNQHSFTVNGGLINKFRLSNRFSLDVDLSIAVLNETFNIGVDGIDDGLVGASASLVFKLGKVGFQEAVLKDQSLIDELNDQINSLRANNAELSKRPEKCPECPEVKPVPPAEKKVYVPNVVFFRINSASIDKNQEISIFNTAEYLKNNPEVKVRVVAYADKKTGTAAYNDKLSEKRAKNVAKALTGKYNIDSSRVAVEWKGATEQPYADNAWNRVAIFLAE